MIKSLEVSADGFDITAPKLTYSYLQKQETMGESK